MRLAESEQLKDEANALFKAKRHQDALAKYGDALAACPFSAEYHLAVLNSNAAACHLHLKQWADAITCATSALDALAPARFKRDEEEGDEGDEGEEGEEDAEEKKQSVQRPDPVSALDADRVQRLKVKSLLRRASARNALGGAAELSAALEDYKLLREMPLTSADEKTVLAELVALPPRIAAAEEVLRAEMMGQLKTVCPVPLKSAPPSFLHRPSQEAKYTSSKAAHDN